MFSIFGLEGGTGLGAVGISVVIGLRVKKPERFTTVAGRNCALILGTATAAFSWTVIAPLKPVSRGALRSSLSLCMGRVTSVILVGGAMGYRHIVKEAAGVTEQASLL